MPMDVGPVTLNPQHWRLLEKIDEMTPPKYRRVVRDAVRAEDVIQGCGLARVGDPGTRMALALRDLAKLAVAGYLERAKDEEGGGPMKYRLTQLAEREILTTRINRALAEIDREHSLLLAAEARADMWMRRAQGLRDEVEWSAATRWWQLRRRWRGRRAVREWLETTW